MTTRPPPAPPAGPGDLPADANIALRINWIMQQVDFIAKIGPDMSKPAGERLNYSIISHDSVTELLRPFIVEAGIIYYPLGGSGQLVVDGNRTQFTFQVRFENVANRDDFIDVETMGFGIDKQDKGPGKAISYGVKYALLKLFGLRTGDDPDQDQGSDFNHRSRIDEAIAELDKAIDVAAEGDAASFTVFMSSEATRASMTLIQGSNGDEFVRLRRKMSDTIGALKKKEQAATPPAEAETA